MPQTKPQLTDSDFCRASKRIGCEVAAIKAVADVESAGHGFYDDGFPVILFERHKFHKFTDGRFDKDYPEISNPKSGGYGEGGDNQRRKFSVAFSLDPIAAMKSCSWGKFQIMGFNYELCDFKTVGSFVDAMKAGEGQQLDAFVAFILNTGLGDELRHKDWPGLADGYNGPNYRDNQYDTKLSAAYKKHSKENIDCSQVSAAVSDTYTQSPATSKGIDSVEPQSPPPITTAVEQVKAESTQSDDTLTTTQTTITTQAPKGDAPEVPPVQVSKNQWFSYVVSGFGGASGLATAIWGWAGSNLNAVGIGLICLTLIILALMFRKALLDAIRMQAASDPDKKNVT